MEIEFINTNSSPSIMTVFKSFPLEELKENKAIHVVASLETKTRINTSMCIGTYRCGLNCPIEGFKTHYKKEFSYFTGEPKECWYFVKSKKQGLEEYKEYVSKILKENFEKFGIDKLTVYLRLGNTFSV